MPKTFGRSPYPSIKKASKHEHGAGMSTYTHKGKSGGSKSSSPKSSKKHGY